MARRAEKLTGTAGELFTAFELTMLGVECDLIKQDGTDVVAVKGDGVFVAQRIEVKIATLLIRNIAIVFQHQKANQKGHTQKMIVIFSLGITTTEEHSILPVGCLPGVTKKIISIHLKRTKFNKDLGIFLEKKKKVRKYLTIWKIIGITKKGRIKWIQINGNQ